MSHIYCVKWADTGRVLVDAANAQAAMAIVDRKLAPNFEKAHTAAPATSGELAYVPSLSAVRWPEVRRRARRVRA